MCNNSTMFNNESMHGTHTNSYSINLFVNNEYNHVNKKKIKIKMILDIIVDCFSNLQSLYTYENITAIIDEAYDAEEQDYGRNEAIQWGSDFQWPLDIINRDMLRFYSSNKDISVMTSEVHSTAKHDRLSVNRVDAYVSTSNPDFVILRELADGMTVLTADDFIPNCKPPPIRKLYTQLSNPVNKMLLDLWHDDLVFILPTSTATNIPGIHFSPVHWTKKRGKKSGRNLFDSSDSASGQALNSIEARDMLRTKYGDIKHPTIVDIILMILEYEKDVTDADLSRVVLWKSDLSKAFTLLDFHCKNVQLIACQLTDGYTLIYHTGCFGWTGTPFAFDVVTRVIRTTLQTQQLHGLTNMYVDDLFGVTLENHLITDRCKAKSLCTNLLGSKAINDSKDEDGRRLEIIGWTIDLNNRVVTISRKNFLKTVYAFFDVDVNSPVPFCCIERLASLSSRYTLVLRHMRPYTTLLFGALHGYRNRNISIKLSEYTRIAILMWRALLCLLDLRETSFSRTLESFRSYKPSVMLQYDASLQGIGFLLHDITVSPPRLLAVASLALPFDLQQQSGYQNAAEFIAVLLGVMSLIRLGYHNCGIHLVGDNISSLKRSDTERFKGDLAVRASTMYIISGIEYNTEVVSVEHVPGIDNVICDKLSRGVCPNELGYYSNIIIPDKFTNQCFSLSNPLTQLANSHEVCSLWNDTRLLLNNSR